MIKITTCLLILLISSNCFADYKHFEDYIDIKQTRASDPKYFRAHYTAKEKDPTPPLDDTYKNNQWHLVLRKGLFKAQVDQAMSEIYRYFLGYSTDVNIVQNGDDYYIARRDFKHFHYFYYSAMSSHYTLLNDGTMIFNNTSKKLTGLGKFAVLTKFFADDDAGDWNYGYQETDKEFRVLDYDNECAFSFGSRDEDILEKDLPDVIKNMPWYQEEKQAMLKQIAETDFSVIENIIRKNITVTNETEARWTANAILKSPDFSDEAKQQAQQTLNDLDKADKNQFLGADQIVKELHSRYLQLKERL